MITVSNPCSPCCSSSSDDSDDIGRIDNFSLHLIEPLDGPYLVGINMPFSGTIISLTTKAISGTGLAAVKIDAATVTGISAHVLDSTQRTSSATDLNSFSAGQDIYLVVSDNSLLLNLAANIAFRRDPS